MKKNIVPILIFNIIEILSVVVFGIILNTKLLTISIILFTWLIVRTFVDKPMHYKSPVKCFFMTICLFISIFLATKVDLYLGILVVIFDGIVMSKYGNVNEIVLETNKNMFQWNGFVNKRGSKYQSLLDIIVTDPKNSILQKYEDYWQENYELRYQIFVMFFRERMTYDQIRRKLNFKYNTTIKHECKIIYSILEIPLNLRVISEKPLVKS